ncbi:hypothetical protein D3C80_697700 [compost metagenome]
MFGCCAASERRGDGPRTWRFRLSGAFYSAAGRIEQAAGRDRDLGVELGATGGFGGEADLLPV